MIIAEVAAVTETVVTLKEAVLLPAGIVTEAGVVAAEALLLLRVTVTPPLGAAPLKVTVPVEEPPPVTLLGLKETDESAILAAGVIASVAVLLALS